MGSNATGIKITSDPDKPPSFLIYDNDGAKNSKDNGTLSLSEAHRTNSTLIMIKLSSSMINFSGAQAKSLFFPFPRTLYVFFVFVFKITLWRAWNKQNFGIDDTVIFT